MAQRGLVKATPLLSRGSGMVVRWRLECIKLAEKGNSLLAAFAAPLRNDLLGNGPAHFETIFPRRLTSWGHIWASLPHGSGKAWRERVISNILSISGDPMLGWAVNGPTPGKRSSTSAPNKCTIRSCSGVPIIQRDFSRNDCRLGRSQSLFTFSFIGRIRFQTCLVGSNDRAARANRIQRKAFIQCVAVSGELCGLPAASSLPDSGTLGEGFSQGWGFMGDPVASSGRIASAGRDRIRAVFGAVFAGTENLARFHQ